MVVRRAHVLLLLAVSLAAWLPSCGAALRGAAGGVAEEMPGRLTEGSLVTLEEEETQDRMIALLESPEMQDATRALVASVVDGALDALGEDERAARLARASDAFVTAMARSIGAAIDREIAPAVARTVARTLEASLQRVTTDANLERIAAIVRTLAREAVASMAVALREELGPAMRAALGDDAIRREMAESARELSRSVVLGMQDGLEEIRQSGELDREPDTLIERLGQLGRGGRDLIEIAVVLMALGLITVSLWLVRSMNEQRRQLAEAHKREAAILALTATLREGGAPHPEILDVVRRSFEPSAKPRGRWLRWRARTPDAPPGGGTPQPT